MKGKTNGLMGMGGRSSGLSLHAGMHFRHEVRCAAMRYKDLVLGDAQRLAWESLSNQQREKFLKAGVRGTGRKLSDEIIRRWATDTGPPCEDASPRKSKSGG